MNEALLAALDENPDDLATWDVLADWLEERDDPRAELMRLTRDMEFPNTSLPPEKQSKLRAAQTRAETAWFGEPLDSWVVTWRHGFVVRLLESFGPTWRGHQFGSGDPLLGHPALRFVRELNVANVGHFEPGSVRHLRVLRCSGLKPAGLEAVQLPQLELAVLSQGETRWPAHLPRPRRLLAAPLVNLDMRVKYSALREWASPVRTLAPRDFRERTFTIAGRAIARCAACQSTDVRVIAQATSRGHDNGGDFWTDHQEAHCSACGSFTEREHDS